LAFHDIKSTVYEEAKQFSILLQHAKKADVLSLKDTPSTALVG
jgi:hypothetical protein